MTRQNSILGFIQSERKAKEKLADTLARVLKSAPKTKSFLNTVLTHPRDNKPAYRTFWNAFSSSDRRQEWLENYIKAYGAYVNQLLKKAECVEDVLRYMPNLSPWTLEQRFGEIKIGSVPEAFGSEPRLLALVDKIHQSQAVKNFKRIKKLECCLTEFKVAFPDVKKIDWFNLSERSDFLRRLFQAECGRPFKIKQGNTSYQITFLCNPFSSKMVFQIKAPKQQNFILKTSPYGFGKVQNDRTRKEHENMAIRADSTYSDAMLEFYLKLNQCPHAPDILYYHFGHEVALYRQECGCPFHAGRNKKRYLDFYSFNTKIIPDSTRLGVYVNDINAGNFLVSDRDKTVKIIDIGHATFANPLTPGVPGITFTLGNLCGRDYIAVHGVLTMEDV